MAVVAEKVKPNLLPETELKPCQIAVVVIDSNTIPSEELKHLNKASYLELCEELENSERKVFFRLNPEIIHAYGKLIGLPADGESELASKLYLLGVRSSILNGMASTNCTPIYLGLEIGFLQGVEAQNLWANVSVIKEEKSFVVDTSFFQGQNKIPIAAGKDALGLFEYPKEPKRIKEIIRRDDIMPSFTSEDVEKFADLVDDHNPAHLEKGYLLKTIFAVKNNIVHGAFVLSKGIADCVKEKMVTNVLDTRHKLAKIEVQFKDAVYVDITEIKSEMIEIDSENPGLRCFKLLITDKRDGRLLVDGQVDFTV